MSTPATFKKMEENKARQQKKLASGDGKDVNKNVYGFRPPRRPDFTEDVGSGRQYTSFEKKPRPNGPRPNFQSRGPPGPPKPLPVQSVEDVPIEVDTYDFKVDPEQIVCFNGRTHFLSNLYTSVFTIDNHEYCSVEHYYQATKLYMLGNASLSNQLRKIMDPGQVKSTAKRLLRNAGITEDQIELWKKNSAPGILFHAIKQKFVQHEELREKLLATENKILAHTYDRENFFATGCKEAALQEWAKTNSGTIIKIPRDLTLKNSENIKYVPLVGNGKNVLGSICMQVRCIFQSSDDNVDKLSALSIK